MKIRKTAILAALMSSAMLVTACGTDESSSDSNAATTSASTTSSDIEVVTSTEESTTEADTTEKKTTAETTTEAETTESATEEKTTEEKTTEANSSGSYDYTDLSGFWYVDGDSSAASIHITKDGKFESFYANGNHENSGYISREKSDEEKGWVFVFCSDSDEPIMSFREIDLLGCAEFVISETDQHFIKLFGEGGLGDDGRGPEEMFYGKWQCERATLTIDQTEQSEYFAVIVWGDGANAHYTWEYPCTLTDERKLVCENMGQKVHIWKLDDTDAAPNFRLEYADGSAIFEMKGNGIYWNDLKEDRGNGMIFTPMSE